VATLRFERVDHLPTRDHRRVIVLQMLTRPVLVHLAEPPCALRANIHNYRRFHAPTYTQTYTHMHTHAHTTHICTYTRTDTTCTHVYIHRYIRTRIHTHGYVRLLLLLLHMCYCFYYIFMTRLLPHLNPQALSVVCLLAPK
jgi:hypothetical protein